MKYYVPYGKPDEVTWGDTPYINGNPSTGTMGSIPPAASIEYPQREIVNFETDSGLTPSDSDLHQLSKSVQNGLVNFCSDQGTPNFIAISPVPAIAAYKLGQHFRIKLANPNTGPTQVNISGIGWAPLVHADKTPMGGAELFAGQMIDIAFDGTNWQMMTGGLSGALIMMTAPRSLYVDATLGDDSLFDGTQAAVDATHGHGPFKTLRHALQVMTKYNLSGFTFNIYLADGVYTDSALIDAPVPNGSGNISIHGNSANPSNVKLFNVGTGSCFRVTGGFYYFDGVSFQTTAPAPGDSGEGLWVSGAGQAWLNAVNFYNASDSHIMAYGGGGVAIAGPIGIYGNAANHMVAVINGTIKIWSVPYPTLNINNPVTFSNAFAVANYGGQLQAIYAAINGFGNVSGPKYGASANGVVTVLGRGASYLPGTVAGSVSSGGQYL